MKGLSTIKSTVSNISKKMTHVFNMMATCLASVMTRVMASVMTSVRLTRDQLPPCSGQVALMTRQ